MEFNSQEKQVMLNAIALRKNHSKDDAIGLKAIDAISMYVNHPFLKLTSFQKAYLRGCVKEYCIFPNEELLKLSDYEVFQSEIELQDTFEFIDTGLNILKKLNDQDYNYYRSFQSVIETVKQFSSIKTVYYSLSGTKIYKVGVVLRGQKGFKIEIGSANYSRFEVVNLFRDQFMFEGTPIEILDKIKIFENESKLEENHTILAAILNTAGAKYAVN